MRGYLRGEYEYIKRGNNIKELITEHKEWRNISKVYLSIKN